MALLPLICPRVLRLALSSRFQCVFHGSYLAPYSIGQSHRFMRKPSSAQKDIDTFKLETADDR